MDLRDGQKTNMSKPDVARWKEFPFVRVPHLPCINRSIRSFLHLAFTLFLIVSCFLCQYSSRVSWCSIELAVKLSKDHSDASAGEKSVLAFRDVDVPRTELLRGLTPPEVDLVLRSATRQNYRAKSVIYRQHDPNQRVMF